MRFSRKLVMVCGAIAVCGSAVLVGAASRVRPQSGSDLDAMLDVYVADLRTMEDASDQARRSFYNSWLGEFEGAVAGLSPNDIPDTVRYAMLALANGVGDLAYAEAIAADGAVNADRASDRLAFWEQRVSIRLSIATESGTAADIAEMRAVVTDALSVWGERFASPDFGNDPVEVLNALRLYSIAAWAETVSGKPTRAESLVIEMAQLTAPLSPSIWDAIGWNWSAEHWYTTAAGCALARSNPTDAIGYLRSIEALPDHRKSASDHLLILMGDAARTEGFHPDLGRLWLASRASPWDADDLRVAYHLGFWLCMCSMNQGDTLEGVDLLETVIAAYQSVLAEADAAAYREMAPLIAGPPKRWQLEPVRSNALVVLATAYSRMGLRDEMRVLAAQVVAEYPEIPSISSMSAMLN